VATIGLQRAAKAAPHANSESEANDTQVKLVWYLNTVSGRPQKKKIISRALDKMPDESRAKVSCGKASRDKASRRRDAIPTIAGHRRAAYPTQ
jgi:hypothetical protein